VADEMRLGDQRPRGADHVADIGSDDLLRLRDRRQAADHAQHRHVADGVPHRRDVLPVRLLLDEVIRHAEPVLDRLDRDIEVGEVNQPRLAQDGEDLCGLVPSPKNPSCPQIFPPSRWTFSAIARNDDTFFPGYGEPKLSTFPNTFRLWITRLQPPITRSAL